MSDYEPARPARPVSTEATHTSPSGNVGDRVTYLRAALWTAAASIFAACAGAFGAITRGDSAATVVAWSLGGAAAAGLGTFAFTFGLGQGAGAGLLAFIQPSGDSCPPERQFSLEESLAARGDVDGAIDAFERLVAAAPADDVTVRLRAADLYVRSQRAPRRAAELYRAARSVSSVSASDHVYATNRLITLYLGPLQDRGAALGELRRLIVRHPNSDVATHSRAALARLKREMLADG